MHGYINSKFYEKATIERCTFLLDFFFFCCKPSKILVNIGTSSISSKARCCNWQAVFTTPTLF